MAEETKKYKYIDTDIDQDLLLMNLKHNAREYVRHNNWDEGRAQEFYDALTAYEKAIEEGRISSDQSGALLDTQGLLDNGTSNWRDKDGNVITQEAYDALKNKDKKKYTNTFYANREVAKYIGSLAEHIYKKEKGIDKPKDKKEATKFDITKHGLWGKFTASLAPGGTGDLEAWLDLDPYVEKNKKRGTTGRAKAFGAYIDDYLTQLGEDLDFSETNWGTRDNYVAKLRELQTALGNGVDAVDFRLINQLGGDPDAYRAFFTVDKTPASAQEPAQPGSPDGSVDTEENRNRLNSLDKSYRNTYNQTGYSIFKLSNKPAGVKYDTKAADKLTAYQNALNTANIDFSVAALQQSNGREYINYLEQYGEMNPGAVKRVAMGNYTGWMYIPESLNQSDFSVLAYNPSTHQVGRLFYGNLGAEARADYANILRQIDQWNVQSGKPMFQQGGGMPIVEVVEPTSPQAQASILDVINGGSGAAAMFDQQQRDLSAKTKADPKNRKPGTEENNYSSNEFTSTDIVRLSAVGADIAALIDPEPISAGVLGLGSDVANLYADIDEGYGFWNTAGNFVANVGLTAVGLIPVFGDALGSGSKVVKTLVKLSPKVSKYLMGAGVLATVSNGDEIIKSFSKIGKDGPENEMTVEDWRNIGIGIQLILSGANAGKNMRAAKKATAAKAASETGHVDVRVRDSSSGQEKTLRFGGKKDVEALKAAKTPDEVNAVINSHPSMKDKYKVVTDTETGHEWFNGQSSWYKPWSWRQKTSTDVLTGGAVSPVYSAKKFRAGFTPNPKGRDRYLGNMVTRQGSPDLFVKYDFNPNATTRAERGRKRFDDLRNRNKGNGPAQPSTPYTPPAPTTPRPKPQPGANKGQGYSGPGKKPQKTPEYTKMQDKTLIDRARAYRQSLNNTVGKKHSPEYNELVSRGQSPARLRAMGIWRRGGVIEASQRQIPKALGGMNTGSLILPSLGIDLGLDKPTKPKGWQSFLTGNPELMAAITGVVAPSGSTPTTVKKNTDSPTGTEGPETGPEVQPDLTALTRPWDPTQQTHLYSRNGKEFGTGYTSDLNYANGEYGTTERVDLSGIKSSNAGTRSKDLNPAHLAPGYDYSDAQANTNRARQSWQAGEGNRERDFLTWAREWAAANPGKTQQDMLAAYNNLIDDQYRYKHEMGTAAYTGAKSYRTGTEVSAFNRTNRALYRSANSKGGIHGYHEGSDSRNGTTTAQRFIDITEHDLHDLNFGNYFAEGDSEEFRNLFTGLSKDASGRYYTQTFEERPKLEQPVAPAPEVEPSPNGETPGPTGPSQTTPGGEGDGGGGDDDGGGKGKGKTPINWNGIIGSVMPNAIAVSRYLLARNHNKAQLQNAKDMPIMLYFPKERHRWQYGDIRSLHQGYRGAGQMNHMASSPVTADGQQQTAAQFTGFMKGLEYIDRMAQQHDAAKAASTEASWQQEGQNQESRYNTALKNRENLFQHRANYIQAKGNYLRAEYEGLNGLLGQFETQARSAYEENKSYNEAIEKASVQNDVAADLSGYGISDSPEDQTLINDILTGKRKMSELSTEERDTYTRLSNAIDDEVMRRFAATKGASYRPFSPKTVVTSSPAITDFWSNYFISQNREGGKIEGDSEKVTIQKLRGRIQRMKARQKQLETRLNAFEKDMDRAQRSASQYTRGQLRK